ncbi:hypothetical protein ACFV0R_24590 [Streptomyces sp. NPDC059578]|uniref:hypothetical protein n=1 Tax=unclassified Streptomyces TaxID=2593676 RepID=UPI0036537DA7
MGVAVRAAAFVLPDESLWSAGRSGAVDEPALTLRQGGPTLRTTNLRRGVLLFGP